MRWDGWARLRDFIFCSNCSVTTGRWIIVSVKLSIFYVLNCFNIQNINLYSKNTSLSFIVRRWLDIIRQDWTCRIECNLEFSNIFCSDFDLRVKCKENGVFSVGNSTVRRSILRMFCQFVFSHKKRTFVRVHSKFKFQVGCSD